MPQQPIFPFRRVSVDHMVRGVTRVWWQMDRFFRDPGPHVFQLQHSYTPLSDATDWVNVGPPVTNGYTAEDPNWRAGGYDLLSHYRVTLTTPIAIYVSQPVGCTGELNERDWLLAREVIRKEQLRNRLVSVPGYLLKQYRYGKPCPRCRDELTQEVSDANCPVCSGTGFEVGYHPPLPLQFWDLSPEILQERVDTQVKGATRENAYVTARVLGFPSLYKDDIWVNEATDERWLVDTVQVIAAVRNVPIVYNVRMGLVPFNNGIYTLEVGGEPADRLPEAFKEFDGCGDILVDHNYGGPDALAYRDGTDYAILGATVHIYKKSDFEAAHPALPAKSLAVATTSTGANGRWRTVVYLDPGEYALIYEKDKLFGPDVQFITVEPRSSPTETIWYTNLPLGESDDDPATPNVNEEEMLVVEENPEIAIITETEVQVVRPRAESQAPPAAPPQPPTPEPEPPKNDKTDNDFWAV
jgi:hypothetical protein